MIATEARPLTTLDGPWSALEAGAFLVELHAVRCTRLRVELGTVGYLYLEGFGGPKIAGALWHGLRALAEAAQHPQLRFLARTAFRLHEPVEVRSGVRARPFVLSMPGEASARRPDETLAFEATLFGEAAETWPAWVAAAEEVRLGHAELRLAGASVQTPDGWRAAEQLDPGGGLTRLSDFLPPAVEQAERLTLRLLAPTTVEERTDFLSREGTLAIFLRSLLTRLRAVARADLTRQAEREALAAAAATRIVRDDTQAVAVRHWSGRTNTSSDYPALVGEFECEGPLTPLLPLLRAGALTHVGKHSAWGMGRFAFNTG